MNPREKARDLVHLAADGRTPEAERIAAAIKAVGLIDEHKLLDSPFDGITDVVRENQPAIRAASKIYDMFVKDPDIAAALKSVGDKFAERKQTAQARRRR